MKHRWLSCDGSRVARVEVADTFSSRMRGLLGHSFVDGALHLIPAGSVHTFGMRFPIDVAFCDEGFVVLETCTMRPHRFKAVRNSHSVIEAAEGSFDAWGLHEGSYLEITE